MMKVNIQSSLLFLAFSSATIYALPSINSMNGKDVDVWTRVGPHNIFNAYSDGGKGKVLNPDPVRK